MDLQNLSSLIPMEITFLSMLKFFGILIPAVFAVSLIFRILFGKGTALNSAVSASMGILCVYIMTVVIYTFNPADLVRYMVPLPFVKFSGTNLFILPFQSSEFSTICSEIHSMIILALLYNLVDSILPLGKRSLAWFVHHFLTVSISIAVHYIVFSLTQSFLPDLLINYGPAILIVCLVASLLAGLLGMILKLILTVVNPVLGILSVFFFSSRFGKQISKAMLTTAVLSVLVAVLGHFGYTVVSISSATLLSYIPLLAVLLLLWYLIGYMF